MPGFDDSNIPVTCAECEEVLEGVPALAGHLQTVHAYTPEDAANYARSWADDAYNEQDAHDIWRTQEYRRTGLDPEAEPESDD
jgi:hypothetical protein